MYTDPFKVSRTILVACARLYLEQIKNEMTTTTLPPLRYLGASRRSKWCPAISTRANMNGQGGPVLATDTVTGAAVTVCAVLRGIKHTWNGGSQSQRSPRPLDTQP